MTAGRADFLRRALVKIQPEKAQAMLGEFASAAKKRGRPDAEIAAVWKLLIGFMGYAFCRAHSTAYGVEAYEAAHLKRYYPAEFLSCVLTHGKGFYSRLVYSLECRRLGIGFLLPDVNSSSDAYFPEGGSIRVPLCQISGISLITLERWRAGKPFASPAGFLSSRASIDRRDVQWKTYCPIADVGNYPTRGVTIAGMIVESRLHHQMDGRIMKFISVCDYSGILECELFASAYRRFGVETIRHPVVEVVGKVKPFANHNGYNLQVEAVRRARTLR